MLFARHSQRLGLLASRGSDFHGPGESYFDLGRMPELPAIAGPYGMTGMSDHGWVSCSFPWPARHVAILEYASMHHLRYRHLPLPS